MNPKLLTQMDEIVIVKSVLLALKKINPARSRLYEQWFMEFLVNREFEELSLSPINDGNVMMIPDGCQLKQAALFLLDLVTLKVSFKLNKKIWKNLSAVDRAYLILHELIYLEARLPQNRHENSMASRYLNGWIFNQYDKMNQEELLNILMKIKFRDAEINGVSIYLTAFNGKQIYSVPLKFFAQTNKVQKALINPSFSVNINSKIFKRVCTNSPIQKFSYADWIEFFPDGKIKVLFFEKGDLNFSETCIDYEGYNYLEFDHNQKLIKKESLNDSTRIWSW